MRAHVTADMLHDGLRGVVFRAAYAGSTGDTAMAAEAQAEVVEYGNEMRAAVAEQATLDVPQAVIEAAAGVAQPLDAYLKSAEQVVALVSAGDMPAVQAALPGFNDTFKVLEGDLAAVSDAIEGANVELMAQSAGHGAAGRYRGAGGRWALSCCSPS